MVKLDGSKINIIPFHPDKCGGLSSIGSIALRNQYLLTVLGINIIFLVWFSLTVSTSAFLSFLIVAAIVVYLVVGPIAFMGPLLPFRAAMAREKVRLSRVVSDKIVARLNTLIDDDPDKKVSVEDEEQLIRLQTLAEMVGKLPVWPFDATTLKRFVTSYILPVAMLLLGSLYNWIEPMIFHH